MKGEIGPVPPLALKGDTYDLVSKELAAALSFIIDIICFKKNSLT